VTGKRPEQKTLRSDRHLPPREQTKKARVGRQEKQVAKKLVEKLVTQRGGGGGVLRKDSEPGGRRVGRNTKRYCPRETNQQKTNRKIGKKKEHSAREPFPKMGVETESPKKQKTDDTGREKTPHDRNRQSSSFVGKGKKPRVRRSTRQGEKERWEKTIHEEGCEGNKVVVSRGNRVWGNGKKKICVF